ncbi:MAG: hypothetical protein EBX40_00335 [Gammaproteobacteria bacterium]|nr:hypothetical protein [Gammaproteobacteria bacterium]
MDAVATAKLALDASGFDRGLATAQSSVMRFAKTTGGLIAGAFAFDKIIAGFSSAIEKGDQLQDIANKFGIAASSLQQIGNAASLSGSGIDDVASSMNKLSVNAGKAIGGDTGLVKAFEDIGLSVEQLKSMSPQEIFFALSKSIKVTNDPLVAFAKAQAVAGKSVTALLETLKMGPEEIQNVGDAMGVFSDQQISSLSALSDSLKTFQNLVTLVFGVTASAIMDAVESYARFAAIRPLIKFFDQTKAASSNPAKSVVDIAGSTDAMASVVEEKKKLDKRLYDEEIYDIQEAARLESSRDKTLFDRMIRDAEFARDEKNRILQLEKETAIKNRELVMRGMEASGTILDRVRAAAERMGMGGLIRQIDIQRQQQQRQTDISLISGIGATPGERRSFRDNEKINALTQTEGDLQRQQNTDLLNSFNDMQKIVANILTKIDDKLGVPILKSAY